MNFLAPEDLGVVPPVWVLVILGLAALLCAAAALLARALARALRDAEERERALGSAFAAERRHAEGATVLASRSVPALSALDLEGILRWTAETARELLGVPYAHVVVPDGPHHRTAAGEERKAYPSWWHPTVQRLALRARRQNEVARSDEAIHGTGGFVAVPVAPPGGEVLGAIVVGGKGLDPSEERVLKLLAGQAGRALQSALDAPGGRDPASGLPNRASLRRLLRQEISRGRSPAVLVLGLRGLPRRDRADGDAAEAQFLRTLAHKLEGNRCRVFRHGEDVLAVASGSSDGAEASDAALRARRTVAEVAADSGLPVTASVGIATARPGSHGGPDEVLGAALAALRRAEGLPQGIADATADAERRAPEGPDGPGGGARPAEAVLALAAAVEVRDPRLAEHSRSVARTARRVGARMGLAPGQMDALVAGALLHDVGKLGLPDSVLLKQGPLSEEEYEDVKRHPELGAAIVGSVGGLSGALPAVRHHHERWDGGGYPDGLRGEDIPLLARVVFAADALDALTRDRPYRRGIPEREALEEIARNSGTQFDPAVVEALVGVMGEQGRRWTGSAG